MIKYHMLEAFLANPHLVPECHLDDFNSLLITFVSTSQIDCQETELSQLLFSLTSHYLRFLEINTCGIHVDRLICLSSYLAYTVFRQVIIPLLGQSPDVEAIKSMKLSLDENELLSNRFLWQFSRPCVQFSSARHRIFYDLNLFASPLLHIFGLYFAELKPLINKKRYFDILQAFTGRLLIFPDISMSSSLNLLDKGSSILCAAKKFFSQIELEKGTLDFIKIIDLSYTLNNPATFVKELEKLYTYDSPAMQAIVIALNSHSYNANNNFLESMYSLISSSNWLLECCQKLDLNSCLQIGDALLEFQSKGGDEWNSLMPDIWFELCLTDTREQERTMFYLVQIVASSVVSHNSACIRKLVFDKKSRKIRKEVERLRDQIYQVISASPRVAPGILREIFAVLSEF